MENFYSEEYFVFFLLEIFPSPKHEQALVFQVELIELKCCRRASSLALEILPFELLAI